MKKQTNPKFVGLMALIFLAGGGGATYYQYNGMQVAKAQADEIEAKVPSQEELESGLKETGEKLAEYKSQLAHLESEVPDVAYIPTLLKELETVGKENAIEVIAVRPMPKQASNPAGDKEGSLQTQKKQYEEISIEIKGRGDFEAIKKFMDALQQFPKVVAVKTVGLMPQRDSKEKGSSRLEATVNLVAYVFPFKYVEASTNAVASAPELVTALGQSGAPVTEGQVSAVPAEAAVATTGNEAPKPATSGGGN